MSCILALYLAAGGALGGPALAQAPAPQTTGTTSLAKADELYGNREDPASIKQAIAIYSEHASNQFESAWKLARASYWVATAGADKERKAARDRGVKSAETAIKLDGSKPEGYFWLAANLGEVAQNSSFLTAWKYPGRIKDALETVLKMDPAWQQGSADRALGEWYFKVPGVSGGDDKKAEEHLRASLKYNPKSTASLFFLAEVIAEDSKRKDEATTLLQQVLDVPVDPEWGPEDRQFKKKAADLLKKLNKKY